VLTGGEQMNLKDNLKQLRKAKNLSQRDLAEASEVTPAYIAMLETGRRTNPTKEILEKLAHALDASVAQLLK
jgi:transcriptional regulator with XRE-family HTH domain